jgi:hypothetical protein
LPGLCKHVLNLSLAIRFLFALLTVILLWEGSLIVLWEKTLRLTFFFVFTFEVTGHLESFILKLIFFHTLHH